MQWKQGTNYPARNVSRCIRQMDYWLREVGTESMTAPVSMVTRELLYMTWYAIYLSHKGIYNDDSISSF